MSTEVNHKERAHALLSASSAGRWMACTPSARLEDQYEEQTSEYAEEGTLAHELAEIKLRSKLKLCLKQRSTDLETKQRREAMAKIQASKFYCKEMEEYTTSYVDYVVGEWLAVRRVDPAAMLLIEVRLDFSHIVPEGFGTGDAIIVGNGLVSVIDLKYGAGKKVSAFDNAQLKLYGVGAIAALEDMYSFDQIRLGIFQPRMDNISTFDTTLIALTAWAESEVKVKAAEAFAGSGELHTGDHCGFCKHAPKCKALFNEVKDLFDEAENETPINTADDADLLRVLEMQTRVSAYINAVGSYILKTALEGRSWEGLKVVEGRTQRKIGDEAKAEELLLARGFTTEDIYNSKIKGLGELEKLVGGKKQFEEVLGSVVTKPIGSPTLAPANDPRPAINVLEQAQKLFSESDDI